MADLHLLRPLCLLAFVPLVAFLLMNRRRPHGNSSWDAICDTHLLAHLLQRQDQHSRSGSLLWLFLASSLLIVGLAGPSWYKFPVPTFAQVKPHVLLLDMSQNMSEADVSPTRLERAKFLIQDILARPDAGQFALIAYTAQPFVVSPLTEDGNTIINLLPSLQRDIMPVGGHRLLPALDEARNLLTQAGYEQGEILVISASPPSKKAIEAAATLAAKGIDTSVMPVLAQGAAAPAWQRLAQKGDGQLLDYNKSAGAIRQWLSLGSHKQYFDQKMLDDVPLWRDEGRWFVLAGSLLLLIVFRRGWLQRADL